MKPSNEHDTQLEFTLELTSHQASLTAFLRSLLPPGSDPRDLLQDVNITLWKKRGKFTVGTNFRAWAFKIARYHALNHLRALKKEHCLVFDNELVDRISDHAADSITPDLLEARRTALHTCLDKLRESDRDLLKVRYTERITIEEYARQQDRNPGTLRALLRNIRKALRRCIRSQLQEEVAS